MPESKPSGVQDGAASIPTLLTSVLPQQRGWHQPCLTFLVSLTCSPCLIGQGLQCCTILPGPANLPGRPAPAGCCFS